MLVIEGMYRLYYDQDNNSNGSFCVYKSDYTMARTVIVHSVYTNKIALSMIIPIFLIHNKQYSFLLQDND